MRLQRYPDGAQEWNLSIWGRHPRNSMTWTHYLRLDKSRPNTFSRRFLFSLGDNGMFGFYLRIGAYTLRLQRQKPMWRDDTPATGQPGA